MAADTHSAGQEIHRGFMAVSPMVAPEGAANDDGRDARLTRSSRVHATMRRPRRDARRLLRRARSAAALRELGRHRRRRARGDHLRRAWQRVRGIGRDGVAVWRTKTGPPVVGCTDEIEAGNYASGVSPVGMNRDAVSNPALARSPVLRSTSCCVWRWCQRVRVRRGEVGWRRASGLVRPRWAWRPWRCLRTSTRNPWWFWCGGARWQNVDSMGLVVRKWIQCSAGWPWESVIQPRVH